MANDTNELLILIATHSDHGCNLLKEWSQTGGGRRVTIWLCPPTLESGEIDTELRGATGLRILVCHANTPRPPVADVANVIGYNRSDDPDSISARIAGAVKGDAGEEGFAALARAVLRAARADGVEQAKEWLKWLDGLPAA